MGGNHGIRLVSGRGFPGFFSGPLAPFSLCRGFTGLAVLVGILQVYHSVSLYIPESSTDPIEDEQR